MPKRTRAYCICLPRDGLLYVETPTTGLLRDLLVTQRFRSTAHFRTIDGYVPYYGGTLAFDALYLVTLGVRPRWYLRPGHDIATAFQQLVEDGVYEDEQMADRYAEPTSYADECEWTGPSGMRFDAQQVQGAWLWAKRGKVDAERVLEIADLLRPGTPIYEGKPSTDSRRSCR